MRTPLLSRRLALPLAVCLALSLVVLSGCLPKPVSEGGGLQITVYGFSIMKKALKKAIYPAFAAKWKQEHNQDVKFVSSFAGSETVTNQILQGAPAHFAILSIERDAERLRQGGAVTSDRHNIPQHGVVNKTPFVIIVRKGNPKNIHDFADLGKPGVKLIHPDPVSSGGAQRSVLAIYGSELVESEKATGGRDVSKSFKKTKVLDSVSFDVGVGESLVLLGASGSGKTTILRIIAGLEEPDAGRVVLRGKDVTELPARERGVGVIFQDYALFPRMTVERNISYGLRIRGRPRAEIRETVNRLLELVGLEEDRKKLPSQLSGGQQQRVAIARTLAYKPEVLLFDEPFGARSTRRRACVCGARFARS